MGGQGCTQLSFVVEREVFAWWAGEDPVAAAAGLGLTAEDRRPRPGDVLDGRVPARRGAVLA